MLLTDISTSKRGLAANNERNSIRRVSGDSANVSVQCCRKVAVPGLSGDPVVAAAAGDIVLLLMRIAAQVATRSSQAE